MSNIWSVLLQTLEVSFVALLLLILKIIFIDKLSPRWQYGIWCILFIRILIPAGINNSFIFPEVAIVIEGLKSIVESTLNSNYILVYEGINVFHVFPFIKSIPHSITDFIFIGYILGMISLLIKYFNQYFKIKKVL